MKNISSNYTSQDLMYLNFKIQNTTFEWNNCDGREVNKQFFNHRGAICVPPRRTALRYKYQQQEHDAPTSTSINNGTKFLNYENFSSQGA